MQLYNDYRVKSFWLEQSGASYSESPALEGMLRADVLIVGGGLTGISTAYHLKKANPGMRVAVLEADVVGSGGSGRNAGIVNTQFGLSLGFTARRFGAANALAAHRYMERAVDYAGELVRAHALKCAWEPSGFLRVATTPAYALRIQREVALAHALGIAGIEWIGAVEARALVDSPTYLGAWREPRGALVNPVEFVRELKRIAVGMGVEVYERSPVTNLEFTAPARAQTPHGAVEADRLVLATNAFTAQFELLQSRQAPVHTSIVLTEPLNAAQLARIGWRGRQGIGDARNLAHYYRLTPDNRLLAGGGDVRYFRGNQTRVEPYPASIMHLQGFIAETFPALHGLRITHRWGVPTSATLDTVPHIGAIGDGSRIVYSVGSMGRGTALATLSGLTISHMIAGAGAQETPPFFVNRRVIPLPPEPLRAPLAHGILGLMRAQDAYRERQGLGAPRQR